MIVAIASTAAGHAENKNQNPRVRRHSKGSTAIGVVAIAGGLVIAAGTLNIKSGIAEINRPK